MVALLRILGMGFVPSVTFSTLSLALALSLSLSVPAFGSVVSVSVGRRRAQGERVVDYSYYRYYSCSVILFPHTTITLGSLGVLCDFTLVILCADVVCRAKLRPRRRRRNTRKKANRLGVPRLLGTSGHAGRGRGSVIPNDVEHSVSGFPFFCFACTLAHRHQERTT